MRIMMIVKASKDSEAGAQPSQKMLSDMMAFNEAMVKAGVLLAAEGLHASSKGARLRFSGGERTVIDGPFTETKDLIAGFWLMQVKSWDEALDWLRRCPNPHDDQEAEVELRQVFDSSDFENATPEMVEQEAAMRAATEARA